MPTEARQLALEELAGAAIAELRTFSSRVPLTYLLAKTAYPFLPPRSAHLDAFWADASPVARAVFLLDYVGRLYSRIPLDAAVPAGGPLIVFRTIDHPQSTRHPRGAAPDPRGYAVFFDTDCGHRVELHMGHPSYMALAMVFSGPFPAERRGGRAS